MECLDGTLYTDDQGTSWMVFCHEWLQVQDGEICAIQLTNDFRISVGEPVILIRADEAKWTKKECKYIMDGPLLYKSTQGKLIMLWSSVGEKGYAIGISISETGKILGPWSHQEKPLFAENGGHGMLFHSFNGELLLTIHAPNHSPDERPIFFSVEEEEDGLKIIK